jgi:hypothetical protein
MLSEITTTPKLKEWMNTWLTGTPACYSDVVDRVPTPPPVQEVVEHPVPASPESDIAAEIDNTPIVYSPSPAKPVKKRQRDGASSTAHKPSKKRPRVPAEQCVIYTEATEQTLADMTMPRSAKIHPEDNERNINTIQTVSKELERRGLLEEALVDRPPHPLKDVYKLKDPSQKVLASQLNRKATDHYNKRKLAWNKAEAARLSAFLNLNS